MIIAACGLCVSRTCPRADSQSSRRAECNCHSPIKQSTTRSSASCARNNSVERYEARSEQRDIVGETLDLEAVDARCRVRMQFQADTGTTRPHKINASVGLEFDVPLHHPREETHRAR